MYFKQGFQHRLGTFTADVVIRLVSFVAIDVLKKIIGKHNESLDENHHEVSEEENATNPHNNPVSQETHDLFGRIYENPAENNEEDK